jgi:small-conductance mechanosensitive channel
MIEDLAKTFSLNPTTFSLIALAVLLLAALIVGFIVNRILHHWAHKLQNSWGEFFFALFESLPVPLLILTALYIGLQMLTLPSRYERIGSKLILALTILVLAYFPAKASILFLRRFGQKNPGLQQVAQPAGFLIRALFALLAIIIVLENLGISLTAVWTTLGVGSVAVALALQDTLSNFFAGLYILVSRPVRPGDFIRLDSGHEGFVVSVGGRATNLRTPQHNMIIVPNSTLAKAVITNYSLPEPRMAVAVPVSVAYGTDPKRVEDVLLESASDALRDRLEGLLPDPAPLVRFNPGFGDSSMDFSLIVHVRQFTDQIAVQSELRKRIVDRFEKEGIQIPFPTRTVQLERPLRRSRGDAGATS